jgi:hypothetical protein
MNQFLQRLGFSASDRVVIVHADDMGMCHATIPAVADLFDAGLVSSAAAMVPCGWFPAAARHCREAPTIDVGVHVTLTCEWQTPRWAPISTVDRASGLFDDEGYLHRTSEAVAGADPAAVAGEIEAPIARAQAAGIDVTHIDSHMGAVFHPALLAGYLAAAERARVPAFVPRFDAASLLHRGIPEPLVAPLLEALATCEARGLPLIDHLAMMPLDDPRDRVGMARRLFDGLRPGLSYLILHPAVDTPELRAIAPDWRCRVADHEAFSDVGLRHHVAAQGIHVIGWRVIRDALRAAAEAR